jgi:hypothetical protein
MLWEFPTANRFKTGGATKPALGSHSYKYSKACLCMADIQSGKIGHYSLKALWNFDVVPKH